MVTVLNLGGGNKKSWIKDILIIGIVAIGGYLLYNAITGEKAPNGGAGGGGGSTTLDMQKGAMEQTLGLFGQQLQSMGSGLKTTDENVNTLWDYATGMYNANPFTFNTGMFYDWFTDWFNTSEFNTPPPAPDGGGNGGTITEGSTPSFKRTAPAPVTQVLSLPAKMHEIIPNLVVPVVPESATPSFKMAIRELFPAQLL